MADAGVPWLKFCDICNDKIGLYQPFYTIKIKSWLCTPKNVKHNPMTLCPSCFNAYEKFLIEREVEANHAKNYSDIKKEDN